MEDNPPTPDYYTVLQVHPGADREVIEAAYRQLMKKYHPDVAGLDAVLAEQYHQRASVINKAYSVLRDADQRRHYDGMHGFDGTAWARPRRPRAPPSPVGIVPPGPAWEEVEESIVGPASRGPLGSLAAAYYLLPGPYEWEGGHGHEFLTTCLLIPVGIAAFALATGRLAPWVGHSLPATLVVWALLVLATLPSWSSLPRLAIAGVPSAVLLTGYFDAAVRQASVPAWAAWAVVGFFSLALSARLYVFAVLPTLGMCWLLSRLG